MQDKDVKNGDTSNLSKEDRLREALRLNLRKRKAQKMGKS